MIITPQDSEKLLALDVYAIAVSGRMDPAKDQDEPWLGRELFLTVSLSGFGETSGNATVTWQSSGSGETLDEAFSRALLYAPAQLESANARAAGRLGEILPEYDPDGTRTRKTRRAPKLSGPKISAEQLSVLLGDLAL